MELRSLNANWRELNEFPRMNFYNDAHHFHSNPSRRAEHCKEIHLGDTGSREEVESIPGTNPWLEEHWPGVHVRLIAYLADAIAAKLPEDLMSLPEEGVSISTDGTDQEQSFRADVAVKEAWQPGSTSIWSPTEDAGLEARAAIPTIVETAPMTERWIEIREATGRLITVIEILSPANKIGSGWHDYMAKRRTLPGIPDQPGGDRPAPRGKQVFPEGFTKLPRQEAAHYFISIKRAGQTNRREIYRPLLKRAPPGHSHPPAKKERRTCSSTSSRW